VGHDGYYCYFGHSFEDVAGRVACPVLCEWQCKSLPS